MPNSNANEGNILFVTTGDVAIIAPIAKKIGNVICVNASMISDDVKDFKYAPMFLLAASIL